MLSTKNILLFFLSTTLFSGAFAQLKDVEGKEYTTVSINNRLWMAENLNVSRFRNGDIIPEVKDINKWIRLKTPAWCYYENNTADGKVYGKLYNWYAVTDPRGLAPEGWRIPTEVDFKALSEFLGGDMTSGEKLKDKAGWKSYSGTEANGTNSVGFKALPAGNTSIMGFANKGYITGFWTSSKQADLNQPIYYGIFGDGKTFLRNFSDFETGFSVRCIKE